MTDTARDLIAAIHANPEEDSVRLVYADYLQETGDEMRAELIRVQIELETMRDAMDPKRNMDHDKDGRLRFIEPEGYGRWKELRSRELWLFTCNRSVLLPKCPNCKGYGFVAYHSEGECRVCGKAGVVGTGRVGKLERGLLTTLPVYLNWVFEEQGGLYATKWAVDTLNEFPEIASMPLMGVDECLTSRQGVYWWRDDVVYDHEPRLPALFCPLMEFASKREALYALGVKVVQQIRKRGSQS